MKKLILDIRKDFEDKKKKLQETCKEVINKKLLS